MRGRSGGGGGGVGGGGGGGGGARMRLHKRRPGHRRPTQHHVASSVEPVCDMRKVVNGVVSVDQDKLNKLVQREPIDDHYAVEEEPFASGLFATVRKCRHRMTGVEYAAKYAAKLRYGQDCTTEILHEIALMSLCTTNPRIIHLVDVFDTPTHMILVMEYAPGGDLQTLMDDDMVPYERDAVKFVRQVLEGLLFLHERNMAHLDIKLQNVLLMGTFPDCDVKLCDLEISRIIIDGQEVRELLGTPDYVSPEILHYEPITLAADIWSVGVMAYVLLTGFTPFGGDTDQETFQNICHGQLDFPDELFEDISTQAVDFIRKTLSGDPRGRPTVRECLKHPWLMAWKNVASHQRETISSESQRKNSAVNGTTAAACPRSAAASAASINGHSSAAARSLQRAMSKSREVLYERVAASNLRKSTSKSRERLCEMKWSVSRSRDHLCNLQPSMGQSRERLHMLRNLSKSHEVLSLQSPLSPLQQLPVWPQSSQPNGPFHLLPLTPMTQSMGGYFPSAGSQCHLPESLPDLTSLPQLISPAVKANDELLSRLSAELSESTETLCDEDQQTIQVTEPSGPVQPTAQTTPQLTPESLTLVAEQNKKQSERQVEVSQELEEEKTPSNSRSATPTLKEPTTVAEKATRRFLPLLLITDLQSAEEHVSPNKLAPSEAQDEAIPSSTNPTSDINASALPSSPKSPQIIATPPKSPRTTVTPPKSPRTTATPPKSPKSPIATKSPLSLTFPPPPVKVPWSPAPLSPVSPPESTALGATAPSSPAPIKVPWPPAPSSPIGPPESTTPRSPAPIKVPWPPAPSSPIGPPETAVPRSPAPVKVPWSPAPLSPIDPPESTVTSSPAPVKIPWSPAPLSPVGLPENTHASLNTLSPSEPLWPKAAAALKTANAASIDTSSLTDDQRNILPSILNRRRASWAYGSKQEDIATTPTFAKKGEVKLRVCDLINNFNQSSAVTPTVSLTDDKLPAPSKIKLPVFSVDTTKERIATAVFSDKEKAVFKPLANSIQAFQKNSRTHHHLSWDARTLPRLPEDTVCSTEDIQQQIKAHAAPPVPPLLPESSESSIPRSGSVSSDTGCSSSSDLSDRSSEEGPERRDPVADTEVELPETEASEAEELETEDAVAPLNWSGRPRSLSVQSDISLLVQPWNRVCIGSVARAFEKFGTKVEDQPIQPLASATTPAMTNNLRSRRQSTPGLK